MSDRMLVPGQVSSRPLRQVCVYCASSTQADPQYAEDARRLGAILAQSEVTVIYGGGSVGSMGALADGALAQGGRVIGVLPRFMYDLEWGHSALTELRIVNDLHERKRIMISEGDAVVALPGGTGTFEELLEALTWKRLGLYCRPIVVLNTRGYFDPLSAAARRRHLRTVHGRTASSDVAARRPGRRCAARDSRISRLGRAGALPQLCRDVSEFLSPKDKECWMGAGGLRRSSLWCRSPPWPCSW